MINIEPYLLKMKHRKPFVILAPIVLGLIAGGVLIVKPSMGRLLAAKAELESLKQKEASYNVILESEKKVAALKGRFTGDKTWLIEQLNVIAGKTGFSIITILPEESRKVGDHLERASVRIEAEGGYHQLGEFVSHIENLEPYVKVLSVDINADTATSQSPVAPGGSAARAKRVGALYNISLSVGLFKAQGTGA